MDLALIKKLETLRNLAMRLQGTQKLFGLIELYVFKEGFYLLCDGQIQIHW